jgi:phospholipid transport system substrate-binding protein
MMFAGTRIRGRFAVFCFALMLAFGARAVAAAPDVEAAREVIKDFGQEVLEVLGPDGQKDENQREKLTQLLQQAIDLDVTGRLILAKNWRRASEQQRTTYLDLFRPYALDNLASKIRASSAEIPLQTFDVVGVKPVGKNDVMVSTDLHWPGYPPYRLDWRLRAQNDGSLQAIDVMVQGISMVVTQRAEFASVIERRGFDGLLDRMRDQVERQL